MTFTHFLAALLSPAKYKTVSGKLFIKEAFHGWESLTEHIKREHPELEDIMIESTRKK